LEDEKLDEMREIEHSISATETVIEEAKKRLKSLKQEHSDLITMLREKIRETAVPELPFDGPADKETSAVVLGAESPGAGMLPDNPAGETA
jgi:hypothetical protein